VGGKLRFVPLLAGWLYPGTRQDSWRTLRAVLCRRPLSDGSLAPVDPVRLAGAVAGVVMEAAVGCRPGYEAVVEEAPDRGWARILLLCWPDGFRACPGTVVWQCWVSPATGFGDLREVEAWLKSLVAEARDAVASTTRPS